MNVARKVLVPGLLASALVFTQPVLHAQAQSEGSKKIHRQENAVSEKKREEIRKRIEAMRIWKLTEALKLDAETSGKVSGLLSAIDVQRKAIRHTNMQTMKELRNALKASKINEEKVESLLKKLEDNRHALQELQDKEQNGLKDILTIEQQARYLVFEHEFQHEMRNIIATSRAERAGASGKNR
ncbi:MAG: hypothetical protein WC539_01050 [Nitrospirota bacterium]